MALCDRLEALHADAESAQARLVQTLLDSLTQASNATEFIANWQRPSMRFHAEPDRPGARDIARAAQAKDHRPSSTSNLPPHFCAKAETAQTLASLRAPRPASTKCMVSVSTKQPS